MKYAVYSTEDFLADESFQSFVVGTDPAAVQFWQTWIAQHPAKETEFNDAVAVLELLATRQPLPLPEALKQIEAAKLWHSMHPPVAPRAQPALRVGRRARRWASAAGAAVVLGCAGLGLWQRAAAPTTAAAWTSYATHSGEHRQVTLPDGSRVTLNANSVLKLATAWQPGQAREVWLTGEAFFNVQHTAPAQLKAVTAAPANVKFTVHAGPLDVAVLGTQFDVLNRPGRTNVILKSGQVQLRHQLAGRTEELLMKPGELVEYRPAEAQAPLAKRPVNAELYAAWTTGHLDFDNTPVSEIITLLEDTYGLRISVRDPALRQQKLTGSVPNHDVDALLNAFGKSLDVSVHREGNRVRLD
ncbi:FecR family protein [Hymenobacter terricola]|uniref:FecR family protein n=1 Tax=Hymenobacter terricola TaxID=2819236 RepID=UPI001B3006C4|nr:FecR domain-containing protein [Hymenobacter terricola]